MKTRRQFLQNSAAAVLASAAIPQLEAAPWSGTPPGYSRFASLVGTQFTAYDEAGKPVNLLLQSVIPKSVDEHFEEFSLRFRSAPTCSLNQGTYRFKHRKVFLPFSIFIVPNAGGTGENDYEAVFNRFIG